MERFVWVFLGFFLPLASKERNCICGWQACIKNKTKPKTPPKNKNTTNPPGPPHPQTKEITNHYKQTTKNNKKGNPPKKTTKKTQENAEYYYLISVICSSKMAPQSISRLKLNMYFLHIQALFSSSWNDSVSVNFLATGYSTLYALPAPVSLNAILHSQLNIKRAMLLTRNFMQLY